MRAALQADAEVAVKFEILNPDQALILHSIELLGDLIRLQPIKLNHHSQNQSCHPSFDHLEPFTFSIHLVSHPQDLLVLFLG